GSRCCFREVSCCPSSGSQSPTCHLLETSLASETKCENIYQGFSDCILKLGENMASYEEDDRDEVQGLHTVCRYWDEFHMCAMTALWECQKEAASIWETLKKESRKIKFQGSLFDLCSPNSSQSFSLTNTVVHVTASALPFNIFAIPRDSCK
uniref:Neuritin 1 n=1 Tax=Gopherus agassizii TaxID=38772 RepID=A0A452H5Z6_9SAUR